MSSLANTSYRFSHTASTKDAEYEQLYQTNAWQASLWFREQVALLGVLRAELAGQEVNLLDFACGTGRIISFLETRVHSATGVEMSESMLAVARKKLPRSCLLLADLTSSDALQDRQFNLITAFGFFTNAEPALRCKTMQQLAQRLTEDGVIVFNNHQNAWAPNPLAALVRHRLDPRAKKIYRVMSPPAMHQLCDEAGLELVRMQGVGLLHLPNFQPRTRLNAIAEGWCRKLPLLNWLASDIVAVCRKRR